MYQDFLFFFALTFSYLQVLSVICRLRMSMNVGSRTYGNFTSKGIIRNTNILFGGSEIFSAILITEIQSRVTNISLKVPVATGRARIKLHHI